MLTQLADLWENVRVALEGLLANKLRSSLTMLGIIIGVASVIALMSIGEGAQAEITDQITSAGTNLLTVMPGGMGRVGSSGGGSLGLTLDDAEALADPNNVPAAALIVPEYTQNGQIIAGDSNLNTSVIGTTPEYQTLNDLALSNGEFISARDVDRHGKVVVLGSEVAQDLFGDFSPVGQKIKVANNSGARISLTVIGVLEEQGDSFMNTPDSNIYVPLSTAQTKIFNARNVLGQLTVSRVTVEAQSEEIVDAAEAQIDAILRDRHDLTSDEDADFFILNQASMLEIMTSVTDTMTVFLGAIAGISLLVGGIGIMNIMLVSVTERTREIGLRKAVGARKSDILFQFLMEAVLLSLLGGFIGLLSGIGMGQLVNLTGLFTSLVTLNSVLMAVGFSLMIGLFFGIYPANQAAKLNPIEALRYE
ncbi:MAG: ABC transporter permease [Chloroflexota bacterium]|nr:ABC transporter permease [Chloroflexota bacterium]